MRKSPRDATVRKRILGRQDQWAAARKTARTDLLGRLLRLEVLEDRTLLSASPGTISPDVATVGNTLDEAGSSYYQATSTSDMFYSPQWLSTGYGANNISFGATAGNGTGQTIVLVDAYNDPDIVSDLAAFDAHTGMGFGLPAPPSFAVYSEDGTVLNPSGAYNAVTNPIPGVDPAGKGPNADNWEREEALDVEWAHAIAPDAGIAVVETNTQNPSDYFAGAAEAAKLGSVVSMSYATAEFSGTHGEKTYDPDFIATGVTFLAASGDGGNPGGYPAYSPNVVAVGGTDFYAYSNAGSPPYSYDYETTWSGSGNGISTLESEPANSPQATVQGTANRAIPDVEADAGVGVWVYDSYDNNNGKGDWWGVGGTSLATPIWAGLVAIADQGRVAEGGTDLSGLSQTLPALYTAPSSDFRNAVSGDYSQGSGSDQLRIGKRARQPDCQSHRSRPRCLRRSNPTRCHDRTAQHCRARQSVRSEGRCRGCNRNH